MDARVPGGMKDAEVVERAILADGPKRFVRETLRMPDGVTIEWYYVDTPASVVVVPITDQDEVVLVSQYRHNLQRFTLELPAGVILRGEAPVDAAARELREETGFVFQEGVSPMCLGQFYSLPSETNKWSHVFLAEGVVRDSGVTGDNEIERYFDLAVVVKPFPAVLDLIGGELLGMESAGAILMAEKARR